VICMRSLVQKLSQAGQAILIAAVLIFTLGPASVFAEVDKYYIPPAQFSAAFQVMDLGFSNIFGLFQNATGAFSFDASAKSLSNLRLAIDASSIVVPNKSANHDLFSLFAPNEFPELTFMATAPVTFQDNKAEIKGTLKVHGQSKPASFEATLNNVGNSRNSTAAGSKESSAVGLSLRGSFKRGDFNMGDEPEIPGRFGDMITLLLEVQALKQ